MRSLESGRVVMTQHIATVEEMLVQAKELITAAWIMATSSDDVIFEPMSAHFEPDRLIACQWISLFGPEAELRMVKHPGQLSGICRCARQVKSPEAAAEFAVNQLASLLRRAKNSQ